MAGIFGESRELDEEEFLLLRRIIDEAPVKVFQEFNKKIREKGLIITIDSAENIN